MSEDRNKLLERELHHSQQKIDTLHEQQKRPTSRDRRESSYKHNESTHRSNLALPEPLQPSLINILDSKKEVNFKSESSSNVEPPSIYEQLVRDR